MNKKESEDILAKFRAYTKELLSSREKSIEFLKKVGIYNEKGELSDNYK